MDKTFSQVHRKGTDSHIWMSLMSVKETFLSLGTFMLKDDNQIRFLEDTRLANQPLIKYQYTTLFNIVCRRYVFKCIVEAMYL
jgi:hypothetical protein